MKKQKQEYQLPPLTTDEQIRSKQQAVIGMKDTLARAIEHRDHMRKMDNDRVAHCRNAVRRLERELKKLETSK